ncbi:MAG: prolipoprotein diacylglyceryl transferase [Burkholderiales bacterium]|nr:prolipoprotein diacylglyceryl transferase [Burkholderiales bacterium]
MLMYPKLNPIALNLGSLKVHWYGIMYMLGFIFFIIAGKWWVKKYKTPYITSKLVDDMLFYGVLGVVVGGRLGYCLFYQPAFYLSHPLDIIRTWDGGMSFHGGMLGVFVATYLLAYKHHRNFFEFTDFLAPLIPPSLFFGRIGNFINGELWGRITSENIPWAMVFPQSGTMLPRHPSQLYEALGEGVLLMIILWVYASKPRKMGQVSGIFMIGYGCIRFVLEYFRQPDSFLSYLPEKTGFSMGQWLCVPMIIAGVIIYAVATKKAIELKK